MLPAKIACMLCHPLQLRGTDVERIEDSTIASWELHGRQRTAKRFTLLTRHDEIVEGVASAEQYHKHAVGQ